MKNYFWCRLSVSGYLSPCCLSFPSFLCLLLFSSLSFSHTHIFLHSHGNLHQLHRQGCWGNICNHNIKTHEQDTQISNQIPFMKNLPLNSVTEETGKRSDLQIIGIECVMLNAMSGRIMFFPLKVNFIAGWIFAFNFESDNNRAFSFKVSLCWGYVKYPWSDYAVLVRCTGGVQW